MYRKRRSHIGYFVGAVTVIFLAFFDYMIPGSSMGLSTIMLTLLIIVIMVNPYVIYNYIKYGLTQILILSTIVSTISIFALCFILFQAASGTEVLGGSVNLVLNRTTIIGLTILILINLSLNFWVYKILDKEIVN